MKNNTFFSFAFLMLFAGSAIAQNTALKFNLLSPAVRTLSVAVEQRVSENSTVQLGFFTGKIRTGTDDDRNELDGWGLTPEYRYYLSATPAPKGFYVAPFLRYEKFNFTTTENNTVGGPTVNKGTLTGFGGGIVFGRQWVFKEHVTLDMFIGPKYMDYTEKSTQGDPWGDLEWLGYFRPRGGLTIGFAF